jgi:hypothetical protein
VYKFDEFKGTAVRVLVGHVGHGKKAVEEACSITTGPDDNGMMTAAWPGGDTWQHPKWHKTETTSLNRYHQVVCPTSRDVIVAKWKNNKPAGKINQKLIVIMREYRDKEAAGRKEEQMTQMDSAEFESENAALEWARTLCKKFESGEISTKQQAEEFKIQKRKELGSAIGMMKRPAAYRRPAAAATAQPAPGDEREDENAQESGEEEVEEPAYEEPDEPTAAAQTAEAETKTRLTTKTTPEKRGTKRPAADVEKGASDEGAAEAETGSGLRDYPSQTKTKQMFRCQPNLSDSNLSALPEGSSKGLKMASGVIDNKAAAGASSGGGSSEVSPRPNNTNPTRAWNFVSDSLFG